MTNARKNPPAYEVEFIPIERRLVARRRNDRLARKGHIGPTWPEERRQQQRRVSGN